MYPVYPELAKYEGGWPVRCMVAQFLVNAKAERKRKRGEPDGDAVEEYGSDEPEPADDESQDDAEEELPAPVRPTRRRKEPKSLSDTVRAHKVALIYPNDNHPKTQGNLLKTKQKDGQASREHRKKARSTAAAPSTPVDGHCAVISK